MKICSVCKGENVESLYWVNPNTKEIGEPYCGGVGDKTRHFCMDCMEYVTLENKE